MDGIINVYKEKDFTSFDVIAVLRGILKQRKIGHTGTLDPMATGVLPVCLGSGTRLCEMLTDHDKVYETVMILGVTYDTQDVTGNKLTEQNVMSTEEDIRTVIQSFIGGYDQIPPMYSAKKVDGKKLYELAREGKEIERKSVHVDISDIEILDISLPRVSMRVSCGKGTYIRALIADIGDRLGCGAAMEELTRVRVNSFTLDGALKLSEIERLAKEGTIEEYVTPVDSVFYDKKRLDCSKEIDRFVENGNKLSIHDLLSSGWCEPITLANKEKIRVYDSNGRFRAVYEYNEDRREFKPFKMFL